MTDATDPAIHPFWRAGYAAGYEAGKAAATPPIVPIPTPGAFIGWGRKCAKCGEPVYPPSNHYEKAAFGFGDRIWHGGCFPPEGVSGTFTAAA